MTVLVLCFIMGLISRYAIYPRASSEMAGDAAFGMLSGLCLVASLLTVFCGLAVLRAK